MNNIDKLLQRKNQILDEIVSLLDRGIRYEEIIRSDTGKEIKLSDWARVNQTKDETAIHVYFQFHDSIENNSSSLLEEEIKALPEKAKTCLDIQKRSSKKSILNDEKKEEIYKIFDKYNIELAELNRYEKGSQIAFILNIHDFEKDLNDNITISCPGFNKQKLKEGESYYIGNIRHPDKLNKYKNMKKRKLLKIERVCSNYRYKFYFEDIKNPIISFTRGHVNAEQELINRLDYLIIEKHPKYFLKYFLAKCIDDLSVDVNSNKTIKLMKKAMKKFQKDDFS